MSSLLDVIFNALPRTYVFLSTLVPNNDDAVNERVKVFNRRLRDLVRRRRGEGKRIVLAEMYNENNPYILRFQEIVDGL